MGTNIEVTTEFLEAMAKKDLISLRYMASNSLQFDPTLRTYETMMDIIKENDINIYEEHKGKLLNKNDIPSDKAEVEQLILDESYNFTNNYSKQRETFLCGLIRQSRQQEILKTERKREKKQDERYNQRQKRGITLVVVGAVTLTVSLLVASAVFRNGLLAIGITSIIIGGVEILLANKKE